ncbi:hypothetical protein A4A49_58085, partial [Nicotiana attenuata]
STGEKPPDQCQNVRNTNAHLLQQTSFQNSIQVVTDFQKGAAITVHKNRLGTSEISQVFSGSNFDNPNCRDYSPPQSAPPLQKSDNSTVGIAGKDQLKFSGVTEIAGVGVLASQIENPCYQNAPLNEESKFAAPISHGYQPIPSIFQSSSPAQLSSQGVRKN